MSVFQQEQMADTARDQVARPLVAELVGVASAGKTTLLRALQSNPQVYAGVPIARRQYLLPMLALSGALLPTFLAGYPQSRWFSREETRALIYLQAWQRALRSRPQRAGLTIFDHGPIFRLALLRAFGPPLTRSPAYQRWAQQMQAQWATTLDLVIWLDAPDDVLIERINRRDRQHVVKHRPAAEARAFLAGYRTAYAEIMAQMATRQDLCIMRFDTSRLAPEQIAAQVWAECRGRMRI